MPCCPPRGHGRSAHRSPRPTGPSLNGVPAPALVTVHVWRLPPSRIPRALGALPHDRKVLRRLRFGKLLGTASGDSFRGADLTRWVLVASWSSPANAEVFERGPLVRRWDAWAAERARVRLRPVASRGTWSGVEPFGTPPEPPPAGSVAALTRARVRTGRIPTFTRAVPAVAQAVSDDRLGARGPVFRTGIGEAPLGWQGTFSLWRNADDLRAFAYDNPAHAAVIHRTKQERWYAEELFARFAVLGVDGTLDGRTPDLTSS